jgi:glycolate oxidase iron-sulfur subunit
VTPEQLLGLADQCVKCGLCLPHCPTYTKLGDEAESPRGRIALIQGWASGALELSARLEGHLDGCIGCRACETACPSLVAYGRLADGAKAARVAASPRWRRAARRLRLRALSSARLNGWLADAAGLIRRVGLVQQGTHVSRPDATGLGAYRRLVLALGSSPGTRPTRPHPPPTAPDLELFVGCAGGIAQGPGIEAALRVLESLGMQVRIRDETACCGALLRHQGFPAEADALRARWRRKAGDPPLVGLSSACIAELTEDAPGRGGVYEICDYLGRHPQLAPERFEPAHLRVAVHEPCSHRNQLKGTDAVYQLLGRIPGLALEPLAGNATCCGAGGVYMLERPRMASALLADKLAAIASAVPDVVATTNPGCALHLRGGLLEAGIAIPVCHPVELVAQQLRSGASRGRPDGLG